MPAKRKSLCPGCKTPKQNHAFRCPEKQLCRAANQERDSWRRIISRHGVAAIPGKISFFAFGREQPAKATWIAAASVLDEMSLQLQNLTAEQTTMKKRMDEISARNATKTIHEDAGRCSGPGASDSLWAVKQAPKAHHLPEKFVPAAINGEYVDFSEVLSSLSVWWPNQSDEGMLHTLSARSRAS